MRVSTNDSARPQVRNCTKASSLFSQPAARNRGNTSSSNIGFNSCAALQHHQYLSALRQINARRRPDAVAQRFRALGSVALFLSISASAGPFWQALFDDDFGGGIILQRQSQNLGHGLTGIVVGVGPSPPVVMTKSALSQASRKAARFPPRISHHDVAPDGQALPGEFAPQVEEVPVQTQPKAIHRPR